MENYVPNDRVWEELSNLIDRPEAFVPKFRGICFFKLIASSQIAAGTAAAAGARRRKTSARRMMK